MEFEEQYIIISGRQVCAYVLESQCQLTKFRKKYSTMSSLNNDYLNRISTNWLNIITSLNFFPVVKQKLVKLVCFLATILKQNL